MARLLNRADVLIRLRRVLSYISRRAEGINQSFYNGIIVPECDIRDLKITEAMVESLRCYEPPITEVLAIGTVVITGTTGTIRILVNSVPLHTAVTFLTSLTVTAGLIRTGIDGGTSGYTVDITETGTTITITAAVGSGVKPNGYIISAIVTGDMGITSVNFAGGVNGITDADTCFTTTRVKNMFDELKVRTSISFAPAGATYVDPLVSAQQLEFFRTETGDPLLTGDAASQGDEIGFNIRNQEYLRD